MKKNVNKLGFSLAEVLISVGIISVIATLGLPIAQKNIDQAYNKYVYTGAEALTLALEDAENRNIPQDLQSLCGHIASLLNVSVENENTITAANNIRYEFNILGITEDNVPVYEITMRTPVRKTNNLEDVPSYTFYYANVNQDYPTLFPVKNGFEDRIDLIKYYIQDPNQNNNPPDYLSFRQAACKKLRGSQEVIFAQPENDKIVLLVCQEVPIPTQGILRMARP